MNNSFEWFELGKDNNNAKAKVWKETEHFLRNHYSWTSAPFEDKEKHIIWEVFGDNFHEEQYKYLWWNQEVLRHESRRLQTS